MGGVATLSLPKTKRLVAFIVMQVGKAVIMEVFTCRQWMLKLQLSFRLLGL